MGFRLRQDAIALLNSPKGEAAAELRAAHRVAFKLVAVSVQSSLAIEVNDERDVLGLQALDEVRKVLGLSGGLRHDLLEGQPGAWLLGAQGVGKLSASQRLSGGCAA